MTTAKLTWFVLVLAATTAVQSGCAPDARFEKASAVRTTRINRLLVRVDAREKDGHRRLNVMDQLIAERILYHEQQFQADLDFVDERLAKEVDRWPVRIARQDEYVGKLMRGKPNQIPAAIANMWY